MSRRSIVSSALAAASLLCIPASALAAPPQGAVALDGFAAGAGIGDVNGDGYDDLSGGNGIVVWGDANPAPLDASADLGTRGARFPMGNGSISGPAAGLGDLDGDGYDDFALGAASGNGTQGGYIVYGAPGRGGIPVAPGPRVAFIKSGYSGAALRGIGDFNGDGFDDVVASRTTGTQFNSSLRGGITVVLGGPRIATIDANAAGPRTLVINGSTSCRVRWVAFVPIGYACSYGFGGGNGVGDFDGDGKDDLYYDTGRDDGRYILLGRAAASGTMPAGTPTGGWVKLTPFLGSDPTYPWTPVGVGDLNGDGKDDLATPRYPSLNDFAIHYGRTGLAGKALDIGQSSLSIKTGTLNQVVGVGDTDGDGGEDLVISTRVTSGISGVDAYDIGLVDGFKTRAAGAVIQPSSATPIMGVPLGISPGQFTSLRAVTPAGDVDRDGLADLLVQDDAGGAVLATRGPDRAPPELFMDRQFADLTPAVLSKVTPQPFRPGPGAANITVALKEAATVTFAVRKGSQTLGSFDRTLPRWKSDVTWDGRIAGQDLTAGEYVLALTPRDAAGNAGATRTVDFSVTSSAPVAPATVTVKAVINGPDGRQIDGTASGSLTCARSPDDGFTTDLPTITSGTTVDVTGGPRYEGTMCGLFISLAEQPGSVAGCTWTYASTLNGVAVPDGTGGRALSGGANRYETTMACTGGRYVTTPPPGQFSTNRWKTYGSATLPNFTATATMTTKANESGALVWPDPVDPNGWQFSFFSTMSGGTGQAEGVALSFIPATTVLPPAGSTPLGGNGGGLGIGGVPATTVALDAYGNPGDPANTFVGIAQNSTANKLNYVASADPGVRLRGNPVQVQVIYKAGVLTVFVNSKQRLQRSITLPDRVYVALSGSTGSIFQTQLIGTLITLPAP